LVFISHFYHESPRGELFLKHSVVSPYQTLLQYSNGDPIAGTSNARGYEKVAIFNQYFALPRKCNVR